jgi:hypothetical protein
VIYAGTILVSQIGSGTLPVGVIYAGTILASQIGSGPLPVGVIYAGTILPSQIGSGPLPVGVVYAGSINCSQLNAGTISASVTLTSPTLLITVSGTATLNVDSGNGFKFTDSSYSQFTQIYSQGFAVQQIGDTISSRIDYTRFYSTNASALGSHSVAGMGAYPAPGESFSNGNGHFYLRYANGTDAFSLDAADMTFLGTVTGGAASALPSNPVGYFKFKYGGTLFAMPYYNV